ncbi:MAG: hypothetical protein OXN27_11880 [Candidatus Poribacteria bacterium]|nr:hypothetical protein [Candidatus Poribacteria bacterium]
MRLKTYLKVVVPIFIIVAFTYFVFIAPLTTGVATQPQRPSDTRVAKEKKCKCCDRLKRFTKEFEERHAKKGD